MIWKILSFLLLAAIFAASAQYVYPCDLSDYPCISNYLASNSNCDTLVWGSLPPDFTQVNQQYQIPVSNGSFVDQYSTTSNLENCYVSAFFLNETTDNLVMGVSCPNVLITGHRSITTYTPNGQNEYATVDVQATFPLIDFTANLRPASSIDLCNAYVFSYVHGLPKLTVTGSNPQSRRDVRTDDNGFFSHLRLVIREEFLRRGGPIFRLFVDFLLCDFFCE